MRVLESRPTTTTDNKTRALDLVQRAASQLHRQLQSRFKSFAPFQGAPEATGLATRLLEQALEEHETQRPPRRSSFMRTLRDRLDAELLQRIEAHQTQAVERMLEGASPRWSFTTPRKAAAKLGSQIVSLVRENPDATQRVLLLSLFAGGQTLPQVAKTLGLENHQETLQLAMLDLSERLVRTFPQEANGWIQGLKGRPLSPPPSALKDAGQGAPERWVMALHVIGKRDPDSIAKSTGLKASEVLEILDRQGVRSWGQVGPFGFDRAAFARTFAGTDLADYVTRVCAPATADSGSNPGKGANPERWDLTNTPLKSTACWVLSLFLELGRDAARSSSSLDLPDRPAFEADCVKALTPLLDRKFAR